MPRHDLTDEGDGHAELSGKADTCQESQQRIDGHTTDEGIGDVHQRIEQDGAEQHGQPPALVGQHAEQQSPEQHAHHLHVQDELAGILHGLGSDADGTERIQPHDTEEQQVVDVDEVTEPPYHHGKPDVRRNGF